MNAAVQDTVRKTARSPAKPQATAALPGKTGGRRLQVKRSGVHGQGVFALQPIAAGETIIEYTGEVISWPEALRRHPHDPSQPDHTFYFHIDDERVIDGKVGGNLSRWINHACDPNVEADDSSGRIFLLALRDIERGDELFFDYGLVIDERYTPALKKRFECRCGSDNCRGTMLAPKRARKAAKA
jgi:SET domain-containing protein